MHTHLSALTALNTFLAVLLVGTVWRLLSHRLAASDRAELQALGQGMAYQY